MRRVYAFTGIPGTGVQSAIEKLCSVENLPARVLCLDQYLWDAFAEDARKRRELLRQTELRDQDVAEGRKPNWWKILKLPTSAIRFYWSLGAKRALAEIASSKEEQVFLAFHACYHSDHFRWRLSAVDPAILSQFKITAFFTLIDDVYDIHRRRKDDVSAQRMVVGRDEVDEWERAKKLIEFYIKYLDQLIRWRQDEIVLTDLFAAASSAPSHVFSVKHPISSLWKLIQNPYFSYYFSHPITAIRRQENFTDSDDYREIREISSQLRLITSLIEPTTIDEFRIKTVRKTNDQLSYFPRLSARWPALDENANLLYTPPTSAVVGDDNLYGSDSAQLLGLEGKCVELSEGRGPENVQGLVSLAVKSFADRVNEDITWRDHHLVDQTKRIIVFRPMQNGTKSLGVQKELEYYTKLSLTGAPAHGCIIFHPAGDARMRTAAVARSLVETWRDQSEVGPNLRPRIDKMAVSDVNKLVDNISNAIATQPDPQAGAINAVAELEKVVNFEPPISEPTPLGPGPTSTAISRAEEVRQRALHFAALVIQGQNYVDVLRGHSGLDFRFVENKKQLIDSVERHKAWSFEGG